MTKLGHQRRGVQLSEQERNLQETTKSLTGPRQKNRPSIPALLNNLLLSTRVFHFILFLSCFFFFLLFLLWHLFYREKYLIAELPPELPAPLPPRCG